MLKSIETTHDATFEMVDFPICFANFKEKHTACLNCYVKDQCKQMVPPKEPKWCTNPI